MALLIVRILDIILRFFKVTDLDRARIKADVLRDAMAYHKNAKSASKLYSTYDKLLLEIAEERLKQQQQRGL